MDAADLKLQHAQANGQHDECDADGQTLGTGVEELLHPVQQPAHQGAQDQGQDDLQDGLHHHADDADLAGGQGGGNTEGGGEQQQAHGVVDGHHQHQQPGQGTVGLVLADDHQGGGRGRGGGDGAQNDGAGQGNDVGEREVQADQHDVHHHGGDDGLQDADGDGGGAGGLQLAQPELIADGERDEAQGRLGHDGQALHLLQGVEAQAGDVDGAQHIGADQQTGHQVSRDGGQMDQLGQTGHHQSADQGHSQTNQIGFHKLIRLLFKY